MEEDWATEEVAASSVHQICEPTMRNIVAQNQRNPIPLLDAETNVVPAVKQVKRGFRVIVSLKACGISFERCPVWLWTLCPAKWHTIVMTRADAQRLQDHYPPTWERFPSIIKTADRLEFALLKTGGL